MRLIWHPTRLFIQKLIQAVNNGNTRALHYLPIVLRIPANRASVGNLSHHPYMEIWYVCIDVNMYTCLRRVKLSIEQGMPATEYNGNDQITLQSQAHVYAVCIHVVFLCFHATHFSNDLRNAGWLS